MITKKKLKTKFDYQIRTFGLCSLLLLVFTCLFVNPQITTIDNSNNEIKEEIKKEENINNRLKYENEEITLDNLIKND